MFSPEMMAQAQNMMKNMKPEDLQRMTQMASSMDPSVMDNMMKNMGGGGMPNVDTKEALDQMKNMTPDQLKAGLNQAQTQMSAQKQYYYNAAEMLKNEGNAEVKKEDYKAALAKYTKALENLKSHSGGDVASLKVILLNNAALCHLKNKDFSKASEACDEALQLDSNSFKALFRRGQARDGRGGELREAFADVRAAAMLAPSDKAIGRELDRLRGDLKEKGIDEGDIPQLNLGARPSGGTHEVSASWQSAGGGSSSSTAGGGGSDQWSKAAEQIASNPDMLKQATDAMSKMSPEDMQRMMGSANLPPGMDAATMKAQMEHVQKNPDLLKTAMDSLNSMPEEERKKMLSQRYAGMPGGPGGPGGPAAAAGMLDNPDMIQQAARMAQNMSPEDLKKMNINSPEDADMLKQAAEQMAANPDMAKQISDMMKNMPPEQMQEMMNMSSKMRGGGGMGGMGGMGGGPGGMGGDPSEMLNNPEMMKAAEDMMKNMSPEMLSSMAKASGVDLSEDKAKMVARFLPYLMKLMRLGTSAKKMWSSMWTKKGRMVLAALVVLLAVWQHYRS